MKRKRLNVPLEVQSDAALALNDTVFADSLGDFDAQARLARRGFQVIMAAKVFGVASLLDNNLPRR